MRDVLRAGIAIYNGGDHHAAHDAWEAHWLDLESGTDDERLLHGLIQFTAAVYHAGTRNWEGTVGLARSSGDYLADLPGTYREIPLEPVRSYLDELATDPEVIERRNPPTLVHDGDPLTTADLDPAEIAIASQVYAEELGYDESVFERAADYIDADRGTGDDRILALVTDFVREPEHRGIVFQRLSEHVDRREARESDVDGLFEQPRSEHEPE